MRSFESHSKIAEIMSFFGILKYNSVFVTDESLDILQEQGFGAVSRNQNHRWHAFISFFSRMHLEYVSSFRNDYDR